MELRRKRGVETFEELKVLMDFHVDLYQGYFIGRPDEEIKPSNPDVIEKINLLPVRNNAGISLSSMI